MPRIKYLSDTDFTGQIILVSLSDPESSGGPLLLNVLERVDHIPPVYRCSVIHSTKTNKYRPGTIHLFSWRALAKGRRMKQCPNCNHWRKWGQFQADYICATCRAAEERENASNLRVPNHH